MRIDGKAIAQHILDDLQKRTALLKKKGVTPYLAIILIGNDPASEAYVRQKVRKGEAIGAKITVKNYESGIRNQELLKTIGQLNNDSNVHGIIIQRPLPPQIDEMVIDSAVDPEKDVDGFHPHSHFQMPLGLAVLKILKTVYESKTAQVESTFEKWLASQNIVVIGKGPTGGTPVLQRLRTMNIEPKIIDSKTKNPRELTKAATIVISAVGKANMVTKDMLRSNPYPAFKDVILISIGMHKGGDGKLHGDYEEEDIKDVATFYTPTPGGVGPVNVAMLLENLAAAAEGFAS